MKPVTLFTALLILLYSSCKKDDKDKEAQLPPETTTGAMTFGCKVNGKVFVPRDGRGKPGLYVQYVNAVNAPGGGWYLNIPATNWQLNPPEGVNIETDSLLLAEGVTYTFKNSKGSPRAFYDDGNVYPKLDNENGSLSITRHDQSRRILAGTFFFTGTNASGQKVEVTDGRFDIVY